MKPPKPGAVKPPLLSSTTSSLEFGFAEVDLASFRTKPMEETERAIEAAFEQWRRADQKDITAEVERLAEVYRARQSPFDALEAFVICRLGNLRVPEWVLGYFDQSVKRVLLRVRGPRKGRERAIAQAFGLAPSRKGRGRRYDAVEQLDLDHRDAQLVAAFDHRREVNPSLTREKIMAAMVDDSLDSSKPLTDSIVRRALEKHKR